MPMIKQRLEEHAQPNEKLPVFEGKHQVGTQTAPAYSQFVLTDMA